MFDHHCPTCAARVLVFPSQVTAMAHTEDGIELSFTCWCGSEQTQLMNPARSAARGGDRRRTPVAA